MLKRKELWPLAPIDEWVYDIKPNKDNVTVYAAYFYSGGDPGAWGATELMFVRDGVWWLDDTLKGGEATLLSDEYEVLAWFPLPLFPMDNNEDADVALMLDGTVIDRATGAVVNRLPGH